jgi:hypothetical protein
MAAARTAERTATIAGTATALGLVVLTLGSFPCGSRRVPDEIDRAHERLEQAMAVRYGPPSDDQDDRFDVLIGALAAGLGRATPDELREAVDGIRSARAAEREASQAIARRGEKLRIPVASDVDLAIVRSSRLLAFLVAETGSSAGEAGWMALFVLVVTASAAVAAASICLAIRWRRAERDAIAALVGAPRGAAHDGRLQIEVGRHIAVATGRAAARERRTPEHSRPKECVADPSAEEAALDEPVASFGFGRIIEIRPDEPDAWGDG